MTVITSQSIANIINIFYETIDPGTAVYFPVIGQVELRNHHQLTLQE